MANEVRKTMTTDAGRPVGDNQNSLTAGSRGPIIFEDFLLFEKMAHFNRERIPERVVHATYNRDGAMRFDDNGGSSPNYEPNSFGGPIQDPRYIECPKPITGTVARHNHRDESDYYTQAGNLLCLLKTAEKERLISSIDGSLSQAPRYIQQRQFCHFSAPTLLMAKVLPRRLAFLSMS